MNTWDKVTSVWQCGQSAFAKLFELCWLITEAGKLGLVPESKLEDFGVRSMPVGLDLEGVGT